MTKKLVYKIYTLGCKVNQYDSNQLKKKLNSFGLELKNKNADFAIINSCAVTKVAIKKCVKMINKARTENPKAKIILTGCWPKVYPERIKTKNVDIVFKLGDEKKIMDLFHGYTDGNKDQRINAGQLFSGRCRYFIKIQDGCEQFCSYCIIPYARGRLKSRNENEIIKEIKDALQSGYQEIVLSGIHLGLYGVDKKTNLISLLNKLIKIKKQFRLRLSSIEPNEVSGELINLIKNDNKLCRHLHIPLQSGCDKILKLMNRPYTLKKYEKKIKEIRKQVPDIAISTDIIVGFPGETEADFKETYEFIKKIKFSRLHVFSFSAHEKTPAAELPNKVNPKAIKLRSAKLRALGKNLEKVFIKKTTSKQKEFEVVVERKIGKSYIGKTEYYFDLEFCKKNNLNPSFNQLQIGEIISLKIS